VKSLKCLLYYSGKMIMFSGMLCFCSGMLHVFRYRSSMMLCSLLLIWHDDCTPVIACIIIFHLSPETYHVYHLTSDHILLDRLLPDA